MIYNPITLYIKKQASKIYKDVLKADDSDKIVVFLGGSCSEDEDWRGQIKKDFKDIFFIDPFDKDYKPEDNIYDEVAGMLTADYIVFFKGGDGTKHEKKLLKFLKKDFEEFVDLDKLRTYLENIRQPVDK
jgi:hypothetical protein